MVFKPRFKYLKNEKDNFIKVILKLEYLFYQNIYIYIYIFISSFFIFVYAFRHKKFKNCSKRKKDKIIKLGNSTLSRCFINRSFCSWAFTLC